MKLHAAASLAALTLATAALIGCSAQEAPAAVTTPGTGPTAPPATADTAQSGLGLDDALAQWDVAAAESDGFTLYAMTVAIPRAVDAECAADLTADQTTWLAEKADQMTADIEAAKQPDGSLANADVYKAGTGYVTAVATACS